MTWLKLHTFVYIETVALLNGYEYRQLQGVPENSTRQIVFDNFEDWTARAKIENDSKIIKLTSKYNQKN